MPTPAQINEAIDRLKQLNAQYGRQAVGTAIKKLLDNTMEIAILGIMNSGLSRQLKLDQLQRSDPTLVQRVINAIKGDPLGFTRADIKRGVTPDDTSRARDLPSAMAQLTEQAITQQDIMIPQTPAPPLVSAIKPQTLLLGAGLIIGAMLLGKRK